MPVLRQRVLDDAELRGIELCTRLTAATDEWIQGLFAIATAETGAAGIALAAIGGYGRAELAPASDLDLLLLHDGRHPLGPVAEALWYPIWDSRVKLGHAVRTVKEALKLAEDDLDTATSFLSVRHLAGDAALSHDLATKALAQWRKRGRAWLGALAENVERRHVQAGEVAFLLEPDLKDGRGGLRDVHALRWADDAAVVPAGIGDPLVDAAYTTLLDARVALHRVTGRHGDVLRLEEQDAVARVAGYDDADLLMAAVASAGRTIAWTSDDAWHRFLTVLHGARRSRPRDQRVAGGVAVREGEIVLDAAARPADDPTLVLTVAYAAASTEARIAKPTLDRLMAEAPAFPDPWPAHANELLASVLLQGRHAIGPLEALDQYGLLTRVLPEWDPVRSRPQRNAYHRFTVDRHLLETVANASALTHRVSRPDLLVIGALFHDLGKGYPGDHTDVGIELVERIAPRMGFGPEDVAVLAQMVRHHLLLPDVATRRDLSDQGTIRFVAEAVGTPLVLELLYALTEADSLATGSSAWSPWKAELVAELVDRTAYVLGGGEVHEVAAWSPFPSADVLALMGAGKEAIKAGADRITVVSRDRPGLFSRVAGVLSLHGLDVVGAQAHSDEQGMAASEFRVELPSSGEHRWERVRTDLERALQGQLAIDARLAERARTYRRRRPTSAAAVNGTVHSRVLVDNGISSNATVIEVHAADSIGILYRITHALADMQLDIRHAKVQTLGHEVVDTFYVRDVSGKKVTETFHLKELERALLYAIG